MTDVDNALNGKLFVASVHLLLLMRERYLAFVFTLLAAFLFVSTTAAQRNVTPAVDPVLEADAKHNLDVAAQYFKLKKAYKAVLMRFEETYAAYPEFSKIDEFLYYAGMSSLYMSQNKGKQKPSDNKMNRYDPTKLREDAVAYLSIIVDKYPESKFRSDAERTLIILKK